MQPFWLAVVFLSDRRRNDRFTLHKNLIVAFILRIFTLFIYYYGKMGEKDYNTVRWLFLYVRVCVFTVNTWISRISVLGAYWIFELLRRLIGVIIPVSFMTSKVKWKGTQAFQGSISAVIWIFLSKNANENHNSFPLNMSNDSSRKNSLLHCVRFFLASPLLISFVTKTKDKILNFVVSCPLLPF